MKRKSKHTNHKKIKLKLILPIVYFIVWFVFGCFYFILANNSYMEHFVFNNDIKLKQQIKNFAEYKKIDISDEKITSFMHFKNKGFFSDMQKTSVPYSVLKDLIINEQYINNLMRISLYKSSSEELEEYYFSNNAIGIYWAQFYDSLFRSNEISSFYIDSISSEPPNVPELFDKDFYKVKFSLYKGDNEEKEFNTRIKLIVNKNKLDGLEFVKDYIVWVKPTKKIKLLMKVKNGEIALDSLVTENQYVVDQNGNGLIKQELTPFTNYDFTDFIQNSYNYLDDSIWIMKYIFEQENYRYSFVNFFYFSAVTITTLGYGDILPNSEIARILVMIESLLGVVIAGAFVSSLFLKDKD